MNNYEKIKSMSVDDMAEFIQNEVCRYCEYTCKGFDKCIIEYKQWLLAEVEEC